ncbi:hypothetical protein [Erythrobacter donghaensis]|uniref:hypothetical protein n=1 Tax=Erythrobacter donghaensis TaxID=267135 RepID=UPI00117CAC76|nr:hypothetical protein [Erythrobacter donghaensis]
MEKKTKLRLKRFAYSSLIAIGVTLVAGTLFGPVATLISGTIGFLCVAIASDDDLGTCFPLAVFFIIALIILIMALVGVVLLNT